MTKHKGYDKEIIYNGNRFVVNTGESSEVFLRDVDKLLRQYTNLRLSIYNQFKDYLPNQTSRAELMSYIDEQFVRLVKEYDINGPVDFPGYIKTKLTSRVKHSYIRREYRDRKRVFVTRKDVDISNLIEQDPMNDEDLDYYEAIEYALYDLEPTELEQYILLYILYEHSDAQIEKKIRAKFSTKEIGKVDVREKIVYLRNFLKERLYEGLRL